MRWSMWPISICVHALIVVGALMVPLTAGGDLLSPAPFNRPVVVARVTAVPDYVPNVAPVARTVAVIPSVIAAPTLEPPREVAGLPPGPVVPGVPNDGGPIDLSLLGTPGGTGPVPPVIQHTEPRAAPPTVLRAGHGVREPKRIAGVMPDYPEIARNVRVQGVVLLEAVINERGEVGRVRVLKSVPLLDAAAVGAVQQWRYTPTLLNGVPVSVLLTITINFTLN
jgi:periplasmic protein TonB